MRETSFIGRRVLRPSFVGVFLCWASVTLAQEPFSSKPYLDDYLALREHVSKSYVNLEDLLKYYKIDPYELNAKTIAAIGASTNEKEARQALDDFVNTFKDGHFALNAMDVGARKAEARTPIDKTARGDVACKAMGFTSDKKFAFQFPIVGVELR